MPGVPSGKACDGCRKQKKKCDEKQPSCSRCLRLKIKCVGSGQQRFKFQEDKRYTMTITPPKSTSSSPSASSSTKSPTPQDNTYLVPARNGALRGIKLPPGSPHLGGMSTEISLLTNRFAQIIKRNTDLKYNVWWSFGTFLEDVPRRLGTNEALDRAIDVLTTSHADVCNKRMGSVEALTKYSAALRTLRVYLDDPHHAQDSSTLCAVMVLLITQMFIGGSQQMWSGHTEGAAQILKARRDFGPRDDFEKKLFMSLRGSVRYRKLFEGLFNDRICLDEQEWDDLVRSDADQNSPDGRMLLLLTKGPGIIKRGREILQSGADTNDIRDEVWSIYQDCKTELAELKRRWTECDFASFNLADVPKHKMEFVARYLFSHYERSYGIGLVVALFFNCILSALSPMDPVIGFDATYLSEEVLVLAQRGHQFRPMGSGYLLLCASVAWVATEDQQLKNKLVLILEEYRSDFSVREMGFMMKEIGWVGEHLRLGRSYRSRAYAPPQKKIRAADLDPADFQGIF